MPPPVVLTTAITGLPLSGTALNNNWGLIEASFLGIGSGIVSGLIPTVGTGLSVNVSLGVAVIGAQISPAAFVIGSLTPSTTNHLYLQQNGTGTSNTTGTPPANSVKLGTCLTGVATVTSVAVGLASGRQQFVPPQLQVPGGLAAGITSAGHMDALDLSDWTLTDTEGNSFYGVLPAGAVTSGSLPGNVAYTDQANLFTNALAQTTRVTDAAANATLTALKVQHNTSTTPTNFIGVEVDLGLPNDLAAMTTAAMFYAQLASVAHGAEAGVLGFQIQKAGILVEGLKLQVNGTNVQVLVPGEFRHTGNAFGVFGATAVAQPSNTTDLRLALISLGFVAGGGASPMNLNGGALTAGAAALGNTTVTGTHTVVGVQIIQSFCPALRTVTVSGLVTTTDFAIYANATGGAITLTLPTAASVPGMVLAVKKTDVSANAVTVAAHAGDTTEGAASVIVSGSLATIWLQSLGGTVWYLIKT
jgi:hypothetical protein